MSGPARWAASGSGVESRRQVLAGFAACVDAAPPKPAPSPRRVAAPDCRLPDGRKGELEIVAENARDFVMMDLKMTSCPANRGLPDLDHPAAFRYVHLLTLPRKPVTGVEDPRRERDPAIWQDAWDVARAYLPEDDLVLVVNPRAQRTQDQLHVHATRFAPGARARFLEQARHVRDLPGVWTAARTQAMAMDGSLDSGRFGVAAARSADGGFAVAVQLDRSPEAAFSLPCGR